MVDGMETEVHVTTARTENALAEKTITRETEEIARVLILGQGLGSPLEGALLTFLTGRAGLALAHLSQNGQGRKGTGTGFKNEV